MEEFPVDPSSHGRPSWPDMRPSDFDAGEPLTLFDITADLDLGAKPAPDRCGTPDMFGSQR
jgi:hypothetical protein